MVADEGVNHTVLPRDSRSCVVTRFWCRTALGLAVRLAAGELTHLREWLREHVHRHGAKFTTAELLEREGTGPIAVAPFTQYLKAKLSDVYELSLHG